MDLPLFTSTLLDENDIAQYFKYLINVCVFIILCKADVFIASFYVDDIWKSVFVPS